MDDFRIGSVSPYDAYRNREPSEADRRKRQKHRDGAAPDHDEAAGYFQTGKPGEPADELAAEMQDYYTPSGGTGEN